MRHQLGEDHVHYLGPSAGVKDLAHVDEILVDRLGALPDADGEHGKDGHGHRRIGAGLRQAEKHDHENSSVTIDPTLRPTSFNVSLAAAGLARRNGASVAPRRDSAWLWTESTSSCCVGPVGVKLLR